MGKLSVAACIFGFLAVAIGAFGAHALKDWFQDNPGYQAWYETGAHYHLIHAVVALIAARMESRASCLSFLIGITLFSGSLYIMALTGVRIWGAVTPFGGVALLIGWLLLLRASVVSVPPSPASPGNVK